MNSIETLHVIPGSGGRLFRGTRPAYPDGNGAVVDRSKIIEALEGWRKVGITAVICLLTDGEQLFYYDLDLIRLYRRKGFKAFRFPIQDHKPMRQSLALKMAQKAQEILLQEDAKLLVHCSAGVGRTSMALGCIGAYISRFGPLEVDSTGVPQTREQVRVIEAFREDIS